jgi:hypothetical protein
MFKNTMIKAVAVAALAASAAAHAAVAVSYEVAFEPIGNKAVEASKSWPEVQKVFTVAASPGAPGLFATRNETPYVSEVSVIDGKATPKKGILTTGVHAKFDVMPQMADGVVLSTVSMSLRVLGAPRTLRSGTTEINVPDVHTFNLDNRPFKARSGEITKIPFEINGNPFNLSVKTVVKNSGTN